MQEKGEKEEVEDDWGDRTPFCDPKNEDRQRVRLPPRPPLLRCGVSSKVGSQEKTARLRAAQQPRRPTETQIDGEGRVEVKWGACHWGCDFWHTDRYKHTL